MVLDTRSGIFDGIEDFSAVLVSAHSTVVIDMMSIGMPVVGFLGSTFGVPWLGYSVSSPEELSDALHAIWSSPRLALKPSFPCDAWDSALRDLSG